MKKNLKCKIKPIGNNVVLRGKFASNVISMANTNPSKKAIADLERRAKLFEKAGVCII